MDLQSAYWECFWYRYEFFMPELYDVHSCCCRASLAQRQTRDGVPHNIIAAAGPSGSYALPGLQPAGSRSASAQGLPPRTLVSNAGNNELHAAAGYYVDVAAAAAPPVSLPAGSPANGNSPQPSSSAGTDKKGLMYNVLNIFLEPPCFIAQPQHRIKYLYLLHRF